MVDINNIADADDDVNPTTTDNDVGELLEFQNTYMNDVSPDGVNKYLHIFGRNNSHMNLPVAFHKQNLIIEEIVKDNYYTVVDNKDTFTSSAIKQIANFEICIDDGKTLPPDADIKCTDVKFQSNRAYNTATTRSSQPSPCSDSRTREIELGQLLCQILTCSPPTDPLS